MVVAKHYRKNNIAEYILYMWQVEDLIRSNNFDLDAIDGFIIQKHMVDDNTKGEMRLWYKNLIEEMLQEGISEKGHLKRNQNIMRDLETLHLSLVNDIKDDRYLKPYLQAKPNINALREKSEDKNVSDIYLCFNGLYGMLMLKLKQSHVNAETTAAIETISKLIAYLSAFYKKWEEGDLLLPNG